MKLRTLIALALTTLVAAGCKKDKKKDSAETPAKTGETGGDKPIGAGGEEPVKPPEGEVRPPTADDLAAYTGDLQGDGPLTATFETTQGIIHCELFDKGAPVTVANFVGLARGLHAFTDPVGGKVEKRPYFDGTVFHRVIPGFMVQGGDPTATGEGDPGYKFDTEVSRELKHTPGTLSMANSGANTNGAQFFITEVATEKLDMKYNVFGKCNELDVVKKLAAVDKTVQPNGPPGQPPEKSRPSNMDDVKLIKVTISRGVPAGDGGGATDGADDKKDKKDKKGKKDVKKQDKPSEQPKAAGEPDHHDK